MKTKTLTIIVPVYNEEENIHRLFSKIKKLGFLLKIKNLNFRLKYLFINDGSSDKTLKNLKKCVDFKNTNFISSELNNGKSKALNLGIQNVKSEFIGFMDGDCQDEPKEIKKLLNNFSKKEIDIVSGCRSRRKDSFLKKFVSKFYNKAVNILFKTNFKDINTGLKIFKSKVFNKVQLHGNNHRHVLILSLINGFKIKEVDVISNNRFRGKTKYSLFRIDGTISLIMTYLLWKNYNSPTIFFGKLSFLIGFISSVPIIFFSIVQLLHLLKPNLFNEVFLRPLMVYSLSGIIIAAIFFCFSLICEFIIVNVNRK